MSRKKSGKASEPYKVGYGRPPEEHQFKPGRSGNPSGRPRGPESFSDRLNRELRKKVTIREGGRERRVSKGELLITRLVNDSLNGDYRKAVLVCQMAERQADEPLAEASRKSLEELDAEDKAILEACLRQIPNSEGDDNGTA